MKTISAKEILDNLKSKNNDFQIIDVRTPYEWQEYSLREDERIRYIEMNALESQLHTLPKTIPLYILCRSGNRSGMVTQALCSMGYNAYNIVGGIMQIRLLKI